MTIEQLITEHVSKYAAMAIYFGENFTLVGVRILAAFFL